MMFVFVYQFLVYRTYFFENKACCISKLKVGISEKLAEWNKKNQMLATMRTFRFFCRGLVCNYKLSIRQWLSHQSKSHVNLYRLSDYKTSSEGGFVKWWRSL